MSDLEVGASGSVHLAIGGRLADVDCRREVGHGGRRIRLVAGAGGWREVQKRQIVAETHEPGVSMPMVAQRYNLNANQVFK